MKKYERIHKERAMQKMFTLLSQEGEAEMFKRLPDKYPMELNRHDMRCLIRILGEKAWDELSSDNEEHFALTMYSVIAETLGIELV
jgi:hypothetical protein